jgi:hypothetical protein
VAAAVGATMLTLATVAAAQSRGYAYEFKSVGGSGLRGLGSVVKGGGKLRFRATLACARSCPTGPAARGRFRLAEGRCGKPTGKSIALKAGKLGPGGLDFDRKVAITPSHDLNAASVKYEWDFNSSGHYQTAACANRATIAAGGKPSVVKALFAVFKPVGGSGLRGLGFAHKDGHKLRFHATLACAKACPTGTTANGVPVRFRFNQGRCGEPAGKSFSLKEGKLGPGGLDFHSASSFDAGNDPTSWNTMELGWDLEPQRSGVFERAAAACGYLWAYVGT